MIEAVGGDFMTGVVDSPYQGRISLGQPAKNEKCPLDLVCLENIQQPVGLPFGAARIILPVLLFDDSGKRFNLKILLDVDGKSIPDRDGSVVSHSDRTPHRWSVENE